jgi:Uma2 family endonuclease
MTLAEWAALPTPGELVDGSLVEEEMADFIHDLVTGWIISVLGPWAFARGAILASSDAKFRVGEDRGRKPDASVYFADAKMPPAHGLIDVPPSVVVEVVSPTPRDARRDRVDKLKEYAAFGVKYYWLVDPGLRTFEILELGRDARYVHALSATTGSQHDIPGCPGLAIDLDTLWAIVTKIEKSEDAG